MARSVGQARRLAAYDKLCGCGERLVGETRGMPPIFCETCRKDRKNRPRRLIERAARECLDCGISFSPTEPVGRPADRCEECRDIRLKIQHNSAVSKYRRSPAGKIKVAEYMSKYWETHKGDLKTKRRRLNDMLLRTYRISLSEFEDMVEQQSGCCAICNGPPNGKGNRLHVDHDKKCCPGSKSCGKCVRGLLCHKCNTAIGLLEEDSVRMESAIQYIERGK